MGNANLPSSSTAPGDDGKARTLVSTVMPAIRLKATDGTTVVLNDPGLTVVYAYPRTSPSDGQPLDGWDEIPGARGCTPQSCAFRDHFAELRKLGVQRLFGVSTQTREYQQEAVDRLHLPFPLLSDSAHALMSALQLPSFEAAGVTLLKRLTMIIEAGHIVHVFYPVFLPERNADDEIAWLSARQKTATKFPENRR
jgi:peroxiredoxin